MVEPVTMVMRADPFRGVARPGPGVHAQTSPPVREPGCGGTRLMDFDHAMQRARACLDAAFDRWRSGAWAPTRAEQVMAANIAASARPSRGLDPAGGGDGARLAWLARWAPLIRVAHGIDPGPDGHATGGGLTEVLDAVYPLAEFLERARPRLHSRVFLPPAARAVLDRAESLLETGPDCLPALLDHVGATTPHPPADPAAELPAPTRLPGPERQVMALTA